MKHISESIIGKRGSALSNNSRYYAILPIGEIFEFLSKNKYDRCQAEEGGVWFILTGNQIRDIYSKFSKFKWEHFTEIYTITDPNDFKITVDMLSSYTIKKHMEQYKTSIEEILK
jgi:hypothetical protein